MKSIFKILFVLTTCSLLIHDSHEECTCGNLGQGKNPCSCADVVVKAAELPKPMHFVSPQQINEIAAIRNMALVSTSESGCSTPQSSGNGAANTITYSNTEVGESIPSTRNSASSVASSGSVVIYDKDEASSGSVSTSSSGCGCTKQKIETFEIDDSQASTGTIVPSFPPIGDLCYPLPIDIRSGKIVEKTVKVVPAYPGKIVCQNCNPIAPYEICINTLTGEIVSKKLISSSDLASGTGTVIYESSNSNPVSKQVHEKVIATTTIGKTGAVSESALDLPDGVSQGSISVSVPSEQVHEKLITTSAIEKNEPVSGSTLELADGLSRGAITASVPSTQVREKLITATTFGKNGAVSRSALELAGGLTQGPLGVSKTNLYASKQFGPFGTATSATSTLPLAYAKLNPAIQKQYSKVISTSSLSNCFDDVADVTQVDYSYPTIPADAVSLTLAYKNLRAPNVIYRQGKQFVPEDKLSFGHRTVPNNAKIETKIVDIPEEKLVIVDKPVVELKVAPPKTVVIGSYDEREEAKLAELEAFERESITQEENIDRMSEGLLTYKDLGYAPVGTIYKQSTSYNNGAISYNGEINDSMESPCGPLGPPLSDYVPGRVVVEKEVVQTDTAATSINGEITENLHVRQPSNCPI